MASNGIADRAFGAGPAHVGRTRKRGRCGPDDGSAVCEREERQPWPAVLEVADPLGVAAHPQAVVGRVQRERRRTAGVASGVPAQREAVVGVERRDARTGHRTRAGAVAGERVVHPALVPADVDGLAGGLDRPQGVAAGVVDPGRLQVGPRRERLETRGGVAQRPGVLAAGGGDHEVGAVGRDVDATHVGVVGPVEAVRAVARGVPVGRDVGGAAGQVHGHHLVAQEPVDPLEVADGHHPTAVGGDVEPADADGALRAGAAVVVVPGHLQVHERVQRPGAGVEGGEAGVRCPAGSGEVAAGVQPTAGEHEVVDHAVGRCRPEARDLLAGRDVQQRHVAGGCAVDGGELPADVDRACGRARNDTLHPAVQRRRERRAELAGVGVERHQVVARHHRAASRGRTRERAARDHGVADRVDRQHAAVVDGRRLRGDGPDDRRLRRWRCGGEPAVQRQQGHSGEQGEYGSDRALHGHSHSSSSCRPLIGRGTGITSMKP